MTNVFRGAVVGMFTAMLVSLCLPVGHKGNKHSLRAGVTYGGEFVQARQHTLSLQGSPKRRECSLP